MVPVAKILYGYTEGYVGFPPKFKKLYYNIYQSESDYKRYKMTDPFFLVSVSYGQADGHIHQLHYGLNTFSRLIYGKYK